MSPPRENYYTILQVQPDAEPEVIEAAYRQLMRKYHPDVAGVDRERAATLHERAKSINRAYAILRDPGQRWIYDRTHSRPGRSAPPPPSAARPEDGSVPGSASRGVPETEPPASRGDRRRTQLPYQPSSPVLGALSNIYYLLPGPYEWEPQAGKDLLATLMLPPLGVAAWSLSSGGLNVLQDHVPYAGLFAWGLLALLALPLWPNLPRLLLAGAPTLLLLIGPVDVLLRSASVPMALAWVAAAAFAIVVSARLYLFAVLPTLIVCWVLANAIQALGLVSSALTLVAASLSASQAAVLILACLVGIVSWFSVLTLTPSKMLVGAKRVGGRTAPAQPDGVVSERKTPLFRLISAERVCALETVPLRTDRDLREPLSTTVAAQQEANVLLVRDPWAYIQTDDGREGWAEWSVVA